MIISGIIYSRKLIDINKRYAIDSPTRVWAEDLFSVDYIRDLDTWERRQALKEYGRNRAIESVLYIVILGATLATL